MESLTWSQVLAWRMHRQLLDPPGGVGTVEVVRRLAGVQAQVASSAALAVGVRQVSSDPSAVETALAERSLVKTWAMRGTLHLMPADAAAAYLALLATVRSWEKPSWQRAFVSLDDLHTITEVLLRALDGRVLTRAEMASEVTQRTGRDDLGEKLTSGWGALLKPLSWQGHLCYGPMRGQQVTFTRPDTWLPGWPGLPSPEEAAPTVIRAYLQAYGPATMATFDAWLTRGQTRKPVLRSWFAGLNNELTTVDVEGERLHLLAADLDEVCAHRPTETVRLLPGFDQYVLGPGTGAAAVLPPERRAEVSRKSGWISPVVVAGGRVAGVWQLTGDRIEIRLFEDVSREVLETETERVANFLNRDIALAVRQG